MNPATALRTALKDQILRDRGRLLAFVLQQSPDGNPDRIIAAQHDRLVQVEADLELERAVTRDLRHELITAHETIRGLELGPVPADQRNNVPLAQHLAVLHDLQIAQGRLHDVARAYVRILALTFRNN